MMKTSACTYCDCVNAALMLVAMASSNAVTALAMPAVGDERLCASLRQVLPPTCTVVGDKCFGFVCETEM